MENTEYKTKFENGSLNAKLMKRYEKVNFLTGKPNRVLRVGYINKKFSFITFDTERGIEEFYNNSDCIAMAKSDSNLIIDFKGLKKC